MKYWMWLACLDIMRPRAKCDALEYFGGPKELFFADEKDLACVPGLSEGERVRFADKSMRRAAQAMEACEAEGIRMIALGDSAYPKRLANIYDPPCVLFVRGKLPDIDSEAAVAIAGTRRATPYGIKMAARMGYEISRGGGLVISGLAAGIDSAAAVGALRAGGRCIGVLGTAIDVVYPRSNAALFADVCASGALVSEYPPGMPGSPRHFPARNRIMSGLSLGVLIVEAPEHSGALITAEHAIEQGRDVFAVPGNADAPNCAGSNDLLRDSARMTLTGWDVLSEYEGRFPMKIRRPDPAKMRIPEEDRLDAQAAAAAGSPAPQACTSAKTVKKDVDKPETEEYIDLEKQLAALNERQLAIISAMDADDTYADVLIERTGLPASAVMSELTMLQILGFISPSGSGSYRLNIKTK